MRFIELLQAEHLGLSRDDFQQYMRGEPVLPSEFVSLFDSPSTSETINRQLRNNFTLYHELDHHCEKFDENLVDFKRSLAQAVVDMRELLNDTYGRFAHLEKIPQLIDIESSDQLEDLSKIATDSHNLSDLLDQSTSENECLPEPLTPVILPSHVKNED